jgi:hypothetical protein
MVPRTPKCPAPDSQSGAFPSETFAPYQFLVSAPKKRTSRALELADYKKENHHALALKNATSMVRAVNLWFIGSSIPPRKGKNANQQYQTNCCRVERGRGILCSYTTPLVGTAAFWRLDNDNENPAGHRAGFCS